MAKRKIAVLGGGAASLFTVWELVKADPDAYDITVYQQGWRLGGKCASGRRASDHRIEEHGLHLMFGFYENVFRVVREAYAAHYGDEETWKRFFKPKDTQVAMIHFLDHHQQTWEAWNVPYPEASGPGLPGDETYDGDFDVLTILRNMWAWLGGLIHLHGQNHVLTAPPSYETHSHDQVRAAIDELRSASREIFGFTGHLWRLAETFTVRLVLDPGSSQGDADGQRMRTLRDWIEPALNHIGLPKGLLAMARFIMTTAVGLFEDVVLAGNDWFAIDKYDLREWLERHGGDPNAPPIAGLYDAVFASYSQLGAGAILQAALKAAFLFKGGAIWKMQAGMGDTIFTPLFRALQHRGVKFKFFHRVEQLRLARDGKQIERIEIDRQIDAPTYDPLVKLDVDVGGPIALECWPSEPRWDQLPAGTPHADYESSWTPRGSDAVTLVRGQDFDDVVLGISVAAIPSLAGELLAADPDFARHVNTLAPATTATEAMQIWTVKAPEQPAPIVVPNTDPYDTIANMSQLLSAEGAPPTTAALHYLCSALYEQSPVPPRSVTSYPDHLLERATDDGRRWLEDAAPILWKNLVDAKGAFDWSTLQAPPTAQGPQRFAAQYVNTPRNLSDRYVLPVPMSYPVRLMSNGTVFENLYITGDWIKTSLSIGCLECAAMSGLQAARAISLERGTAEVPRARGDWIDDVVPRPAARTYAATGGGRRYRPRDGELVAAPPYTVTCENLYMFFLRASQAALAGVVDDLNGVGARSYRPIGDWVVLYAAGLSDLSYGTRCRANEVGIWLPVERDDDPTTVRMYSPYVWLNSATSTIVGRSIYGYTKQTAEVTIPMDPGVIRVLGDALVSTSAARTLEVQRMPLVTASRTSADSAGTAAVDLLTLARIAGQAIGTNPALILGMFKGMRSVFLKQVPDARGLDVVYQQIVEADLRPKLGTLSGRPVSGTWSIELPCYLQPMVADRLGLVGDTRYDDGMRVSVVSPLAQVWLSFDGELEPGSEVP